MSFLLIVEVSPVGVARPYPWAATELSVLWPALLMQIQTCSGSAISLAPVSGHNGFFAIRDKECCMEQEFQRSYLPQVFLGVQLGKLLHRPEVSVLLRSSPRSCARATEAEWPSRGSLSEGAACHGWLRLRPTTIEDRIAFCREDCGRMGRSLALMLLVLLAGRGRTSPQQPDAADGPGRAFPTVPAVAEPFMPGPIEVHLPKRLAALLPQTPLQFSRELRRHLAQLPHPLGPRQKPLKVQLGILAWKRPSLIPRQPLRPGSRWGASREGSLDHLLLSGREERLLPRDGSLWLVFMPAFFFLRKLLCCRLVSCTFPSSSAQAGPRPAGLLLQGGGGALC